MRLKQLRREKGISQLKLAMDLAMNQNSISRYETGERECDYATLILFADYFDVSIDYLLGRTDNILDYNSAINSTSQRTPFGKSFTATQLLAGFEVKYVP